MKYAEYIFFLGSVSYINKFLIIGTSLPCILDIRCLYYHQTFVLSYCGQILMSMQFIINDDLIWNNKI